MPRPPYPPTRLDDAVELLHGESIPDPYRWLEGDVRTEKPVADWVNEQNKVTQAYLATLPGRKHLVYYSAGYPMDPADVAILVIQSICQGRSSASSSRRRNSVFLSST
mgnify:CR=1 FL=1